MIQRQPCIVSMVKKSDQNGHMHNELHVKHKTCDQLAKLYWAAKYMKDNIK